MPPLDERQDEIAAWAHYMVNRRHREQFPDGEAAGAGGPAAAGQHGWPGNLRQLDNIIRRAYTLAMVDRPIALRLQLEEQHVKQALAFEQLQSAPPLIQALNEAALAFFREAQQRPAGTLSLELAEAFSGFVLGMAAQHIGRDSALLLFGGESTVKGRNQLRVFRREAQAGGSAPQGPGLRGRTLRPPALRGGRRLSRSWPLPPLAGVHAGHR